MPPSTEPTTPSAASSSIVRRQPSELASAPWYRRFPLIGSPAGRPKVFFDSPGSLEQSQHWGALVIWTIAAGTTAALLWAFIGKVDQTVVATGTFEPLTGRFLVKTPFGGIVRQLWVKEGQEVPVGRPLMQVENQGLVARLDATNKQLALLRYENTLTNLLLDAPNAFSLTSVPDPPPLIAGDDRTRSIQLAVQQTAARLKQLNARLSSLSTTLAIKQQLVNSVRPLYEGGGMAKFTYLSAVDELQQLQSQQVQVREEVAGVLGAAGRQVASNDRQILDLAAQIVGLRESDRNLTLKAGAAGRIFNLQVGQGSVVGAQTEVMRIIPEGGVRAKVYLPNSDLGFVRVGQTAKLAVSSFPPNEYGYLNATVSRIGADALGDDDPAATPAQRANTFPMIVTLSGNRGKNELLRRLAPGMQVSASIIVRQRPVISLLTDVFTKGTESLQSSR